MKKFERIFLYSVLAILVFYVFLVDNKVESQVAIQEEIKARRIVIVNDAGRGVLLIYVDEDGYGRIEIANKGGNNVKAFMGVNENGGAVGILNKFGPPAVGIRVDKNGYGGINIANKDGRTVTEINANEFGGGIGILNKVGTPVVGILVSENDDGRIVVLNKQKDMIGSLP